MAAASCLASSAHTPLAASTATGVRRPPLWVWRGMSSFYNEQRPEVDDCLCFTPTGPAAASVRLVRFGSQVRRVWFPGKARLVLAPAAEVLMVPSAAFAGGGPYLPPAGREGAAGSSARGRQPARACCADGRRSCRRCGATPCCPDSGHPAPWSATASPRGHASQPTRRPAAEGAT